MVEVLLLCFSEYVIEQAQLAWFVKQWVFVVECIYFFVLVRGGPYGK